jgi:hypothetical protein
MSNLNIPDFYSLPWVISPISLVKCDIKSEYLFDAFDLDSYSFIVLENKLQLRNKLEFPNSSIKKKIISVLDDFKHELDKCTNFNQAHYITDKDRPYAAWDIACQKIQALHQSMAKEITAYQPVKFDTPSYAQFIHDYDFIKLDGIIYKIIPDPDTFYKEERNLKLEAI